MKHIAEQFPLPLKNDFSKLSAERPEDRLAMVHADELFSTEADDAASSENPID